MASSQTEPVAHTLPPDLLKPSSQSRQILLQHLRLLHLLHHRNKNQHRRNQWFRHLNTFRRELGRVCDDLGIHLSEGLSEETQDAPRKSGSKVVKEKKPNGAVLNLSKQQDRALMRRKCTARITYWVASNLVTKWYTAFTTLAATPSFAPSSLILLALLARVYSLLGVTAYIHAIGDVEEQEQLAREEQEMQEALTKFAELDAVKLWEVDHQEKKATPNQLGKDMQLDNSGDMGVIVSRKNTIQEDAASPSTHYSKKKTPIKPSYESKIRSSPLILSEEESSKSTKTARKVKVDLPSRKRKPNFEDIDKKQPSTTSALPRKKKKSKNAIDALFSGLG